MKTQSLPVIKMREDAITQAGNVPTDAKGESTSLAAFINKQTSWLFIIPLRIVLVAYQLGKLTADIIGQRGNAEGKGLWGKADGERLLFTLFAPRQKYPAVQMARINKDLIGLTDGQQRMTYFTNFWEGSLKLGKVFVRQCEMLLRDHPEPLIQRLHDLVVESGYKLTFQGLPLDIQEHFLNSEMPVIFTEYASHGEMLQNLVNLNHAGKPYSMGEHIDAVTAMRPIGEFLNKLAKQPIVSKTKGGDTDTRKQRLSYAAYIMYVLDYGIETLSEEGFNRGDIVSATETDELDISKSAEIESVAKFASEALGLVSNKSLALSTMLSIIGHIHAKLFTDKLNKAAQVKYRTFLRDIVDNLIMLVSREEDRKANLAKIKERVSPEEFAVYRKWANKDIQNNRTSGNEVQLRHVMIEELYQLFLAR